jgi:AraC family ethanolamine operon transcriptional activator
MVQTLQLQLMAAAWLPGIDIQGAIPPATLTLGVQRNPKSPIYFHGGRLADDQIGALRYGEDIDLCIPQGGELLVLAVNGALIQRYALALWGIPLEEHRVNERLLFQGAASRLQLIRSWSLLLVLGQRHPKGLENTRRLHLLEHELLEMLLTTTQPPPVRRLFCAKSHCLARRAKDYLMARIDEPVRLSEVCEALNASERTLHWCFFKHFGLPPKAYLKILRLNQIRRALRQAQPPMTVTQIAADWGFFHFGRFSHDYYETFGELPSQTLRTEKPNRYHPFSA